MSADEKSISLKTVIFFAVLVSVFALFRLFFIFNPLDSTEGELAYFGQNTGTETMYAGKSTALMPLVSASVSSVTLPTPIVIATSG